MVSRWEEPPVDERDKPGVPAGQSAEVRVFVWIVLSVAVLGLVVWVG